MMVEESGQHVPGGEISVPEATVFRRAPWALLMLTLPGALCVHGFSVVIVIQF